MPEAITSRSFQAKTEILAGAGSLQLLPDVLHRVGADRVAVVCDRGVADAGLLDTIVNSVHSPELVGCAPVGANPSVDDAETRAGVAREARCGAVLAIGGGSALGLGKAVAMRLRNEQPIDCYSGEGKLDAPPAPCVAIPTTAGSGGEVSTALVLYRQGHKMVVRGRGYEPTVAILDGTVLQTLPRRPFLDASFDALTHAYEALWAKRASRFTDTLALAAARTIRNALPRALERREIDDLQALIEASAMANLACGNARLGLVHGLTSAPGVTLAHGYQNGVLLPHVARFNAPCLGEVAVREIEALPALYEAVGFTPRFGAGEIDAGGAERMVRVTIDDPYGEGFLANNRRHATESDLRGLLTAAGAA